jgi:hypothetical protein
MACGWCDLEVDTTIHVFERDWTMCPKYVKHSRFIGQHDLGRGHGRDLTDSLKSTRMFDFDKGYANHMNFI